MNAELSGQGATSHLDMPFLTTFFRDYSAQAKTSETFTLRSLAPRVKTITAASKDKLPWLKLAAFGEIRTEKNSLRSDDNVLQISGVEADYDGERMQVADAVERLEKAGILAMVYTSPSHTADTPRFRVLCPTSAPQPPERREKLLGRLNGLFGGVFSGESWTLSQAYYFGSVKHNPSHEVHLIDGRPIDDHDELDEIWLGKPATTTRTTASGERIAGPVDETALLDEITSGTGYHASAVRLLGKWARQGVPYMEARKRLLNAFGTVFPPDRDARWAARQADLDRCLDDIYGKEAKKKDQRKPEPLLGKSESPERGTKYGRLSLLGMEDLDTAPPRDYLLKGLLSPAEISIWVGPPKCGKSFLMLYVAYMLSLGRPVFGKRVKLCSILYVAAEGEAGIAKQNPRAERQIRTV